MTICRKSGAWCFGQTSYQRLLGVISPLPLNIPLCTLFSKVHILQKSRFQEMKLLVWIQLPNPLPVCAWQKCLGKKSLMKFFNPTKTGIPFSHTETQFRHRTVCLCYIFDYLKYYTPVIIHSILHLSEKIASNSFQTTNTLTTSWPDIPFLVFCYFSSLLPVLPSTWLHCKE